MTSAYGIDDPSEIIDAGQWLAVADRAARAVPATPSAKPEERQRQFQIMQEAVFALEEVLKFIPPGLSSLPESAFWTAEGRAVRDREPGRCRRERLEVVLGVYRDILEKLQ